MVESVTSGLRSPPLRPARPVDNGELGLYGRPSVEHYTTVTAEAPASGLNKLRKSTSKTEVRPSSEQSRKKRVSARYSTGSGGGATGAKRKSSIRNAVRKLFGRRSKDDILDVPEVPRVDVQRHGYHKSDPGQFLRPQTIANHPSEPVHQRVISAPLSAPLMGPMGAPFQLQQPPLPRKDRPVPSPNAVEFPKSARLKPLDLGNPFYTRAHGDKRRATLPSVVMTDHEADKIVARLLPIQDTRATGASLDIAQDKAETRDIGLAVTKDKKDRMQKRRSRSANDLKQAMMAAEPFRKRDDEIEYWRQSHASVLVSPTGQAPTYRFPQSAEIHDIPDVLEIPEIPEVVHEEEVSALPQHPSADIRVQSPSERAASPVKAPSLPSQHRSFSRPLTTTTPTTDGPNDLESRVSRLESTLHDFQRSLSTLTASNLSLAAPTEPPGFSQRHLSPSPMGEPAQAPTRGFEDAGDIMEREWGPSSSSSIGERPPGPSRSPSTLRNNPTATTNGTFTALYNMLSEERSARRTLEMQLRTLQHEVTRLQLSRGSWGSYSAQHLPHGQRPRTPAESSDGGDDDNNNNNTTNNNNDHHRRSGSRQEAYNALSSPATVVPPVPFLRAFDRFDNRVVSRFSGDSGEDSEYGSRHRSGESAPTSMPRASRGQYVEPATPYENYRTPAEERNPYRFSEDEMF